MNPTAARSVARCQPVESVALHTISAAPIENRTAKNSASPGVQSDIVQEPAHRERLGFSGLVGIGGSLPGTTARSSVVRWSEQYR